MFAIILLWILYALGTHSLPAKKYQHGSPWLTVTVTVVTHNNLNVNCNMYVFAYIRRRMITAKYWE
jgi:hypothetical protein